MALGYRILVVREPPGLAEAVLLHGGAAGGSPVGDEQSRQKYPLLSACF